MDVNFEVQRGESFSIEVGFFDTVMEMKETVEKYHGIPVSKQTLIFNGQVLPDDGDIWKCEIFHNSRIQVLVAPDDAAAAAADKVKTEEFSPPTKIHLLINVSTASSTSHISHEVDLNDTVLRLKERIQRMQAKPVNRLLLHGTDTELHDHQLLRDCNISDYTEIDVSFRTWPTASSGGGGGGGSCGGGGSKKLKLMVLPKSGTKKIQVEVNASDNVGELRNELQKLHQRLQFHLPQEGYFFIYKQIVMDDDKSFRWHHVCQGDTIEIFNGSVTGGS
ncbi:ubiquitin domain-containing protein 7SL RNA1-like [Gastrolobium bilobum]|uniref:ubiquitin domain-containing protein 7SL RNA1-like n=1 Tax=Gastrolobium bilobum TaxID=150636 RepID=UPI002AAF1B6F|nr:ubiquitin domain-containing protein 7SL RNA1-like [Gastrolobium bilobum]